jgi:hypothetical protein
MAKMFYTLEETKAALGRSEDDIKELAKEGKLREFRDGPRLMFKTDQVEHLKAELAAAGGGESLELAPDDHEGDISLADSASSASGISLADSVGGSRTGSRGGSAAGGSAAGGSTAAGKSAAADDTALAADLGLSGSVSGMPSSGKVAAASSRSGFDVLDDEPAEKVDPSAQTSIAPGLNADQINIESVGSGSGLLDLTRESDDTSLGAELLDEIAPGASGVRRPPTESALSASALGGSSLGGSVSGTGVGMGLSDSRGGVPATRGGAAAATVVEAPDPLAPAFGLAAVGAACAVLFAVFAMVCGLSGDHPALLAKMGSGEPGGFSFLIVVAMVFALPVILFVGGLVAGRAKK